MKSSSPAAVTVILPTFNEEQRIYKSLKTVNHQLQAVSPSYEVLVINDGSTDQTANRVREYISHNSSHNVTLIDYVPNRGKGHAFKQGVKHAKGEKIILLDGGGDADPQRITEYLHILDKADVLIGSKRHPESHVTAPFSRRFLSVAFNALVALLTGLRLTDTQSGFKAFRADALRRITHIQLVRRYCFDVEVLTIAKILGLRIIEVPVSVTIAKSFRGPASPWAIMYMLIDLLGIAYRLHVKKWYQQNLNHERPTEYKPIIPL